MVRARPYGVTDLNGKEWCVADAALLVRAGSVAVLPTAQTLDDDFDEV